MKTPQQVLDEHKNNVVAFVYGGFGAPTYLLPVTVEVLYGLASAVDHNEDCKFPAADFIRSLKTHPTWKVFHAEMGQAVLDNQG